MTRYNVTMTHPDGSHFTFWEGRAADAFDAIDRCIRANDMQPGEYRTVSGWRVLDPASGVVTVKTDGSFTTGPRWGLPTPTEPIHDSGVLPHGVPDVA